MDDKLKGVLSYLLGWIGGLIILLAFKDNNKKTAFHACQSIVISLCAVIASIIVGIFQTTLFIPFGIAAKMLFGILIAMASSAIGILTIVLIILGIVKVLNEEEDPKLPVVGDLTYKIFENKINEFPEVVLKRSEAKYDPNTGKPINNNKEAKYDPNTGEPLNKEVKKTKTTTKKTSVKKQTKKETKKQDN